MALFDDTQVVIFNKETKDILMRVPRNTLTGLYMLDLEQKIKQPKIMTELEIPDTYFANHFYECISKQNVAIYYHLNSLFTNIQHLGASYQKELFLYVARPHCRPCPTLPNQIIVHFIWPPPTTLQSNTVH